MLDLELELQAALSRRSWVLAIELGSSERAVHTSTSGRFLGFIQMPLEVLIYTVASSRSIIQKFGFVLGTSNWILQSVHNALDCLETVWSAR